MKNQDDLIGRTLGTSRLEKLLGRGGMGVVYLAQQMRPARHVAVKVLLPNISFDSTAYNNFLARFRREADVIAKLEHVNIMPIYEYGEQDGLAYLVMPYLTGGSLRDVLTVRGALSLQETATFLDQAASALAYAHAHGVIHRDIKPSNFLIHADGRLILADFGIARIMQEDSAAVSTLTGSGVLVGTPDYMAPEMANGLHIDHRADIYELGILVFQMLTGHVPFTGSTPFIVAVKHIQDPLPSLHEQNPAIPPAVDAVLQKATAKRPEDRYMSALDLAHAFRAAITTPSSSVRIETYRAPGPSLSQPAAPQQIVLPPVQQRHDTPPGQYSTEPASAPSSPAWSGNPPSTREATSPFNYPITPSTPSSPRQPFYSYPLTPSPPQPATPPHKRSHLGPVVIGTLLLIVLVAGAVFLGLKVEGALTSQQPGVSHSSTPGSSSPTPRPSPSPTLTPEQQATATIHKFYDNINARNYRVAYDLFGPKLQSKQTYDNFVSGFSQTVHDDITLGTVTPNADGTYKIPITIIATEDNTSGSGTHQSTYHGYYIVGQLNGTWKILDGSIQ